MHVLLYCQQTWRATILKLTQGDVRVYRVRSTSDATLFATGKKGRNALTDCDGSATLQKEGMDKGDTMGLDNVKLHLVLWYAIWAGTCAQWIAHAVMHWECQTLQCVNCREYPVPAEEAREDASNEDFSFHVYKYRVLIQVDKK